MNAITSVDAVCIPSFRSPLADLRTPHHTYHPVLFKMLTSTLSLITVGVKFTSKDNLIYPYCTVFNNSLLLINRNVHYIWNTLQNTKSFLSVGLTGAKLFNLARLLWFTKAEHYHCSSVVTSFRTNLPTAACGPTRAVGIRSLGKLDVLTTTAYLVTVLRIGLCILLNTGTQTRANNVVSPLFVTYVLSPSLQHTQNGILDAEFPG